MLAKEFIEDAGSKAVGALIVTAAVGAWPGGLAYITEIEPDPNAPEIVCQVRACNTNTKVKRAIQRGDLDSAEIGVFDNEEIYFLAFAPLV